MGCTSVWKLRSEPQFNRASCSPEWAERNQRTLIVVFAPALIIVADARLNRRAAKKDLDTFRDTVNTQFADVNAQFADVNRKIEDIDNKLISIEHKQNFMQAFALRSTVQILKAIDGDGDKEEIKKFIKDGEKLIGCMEHGGKGVGRMKRKL